MSVTAGAITNIIANLFLIAMFNAYGSAVATVISELITTLVQLYFIRNTISRRKLLYSSLYYFIDGCIMFLIVLYFSNKVKISFVSLAVEVLPGAFIYILLLCVFQAPIIKQAKELLSHPRKSD